MKHGASIVIALALASCGKKDSNAQATASGGGSSGASKVKAAELLTKKLAFEAYPTWAMKNPETSCPATLAELLAQVDDTPGKDPWGNDLKMFCGPTLPAEAKGLAIQSAGPDGKLDTADDIKSWL
jgi:hypothetical protein